MRILCLILLTGALLTAQVNTGSISGLVSDGSGSSIAGAVVTLLNTETGIRQTSSSSSAGTYLFTPLQPGSYTVRAEAKGFKSIERAGLRLEIAQKLGVDVQLPVGDAAETVQVTAEAPLLDTTNASVGQVIDRRKIMELPLPSRDPLRLAQIAPGVGGRDSSLGDFRLGGGRVRQAEFYVDGSPTSAVGDARAVGLPSIDAIQEFKVETNNLSAEYGRSSGGSINIQTRSGGNAYHGSLYEFGQSELFNANSWDNNRRGSPLGSYQQHQFGGTIGGPVVLPKIYDGHNRTFFFFNFDGFRQYQEGSLRFATVPTALERQGDFSKSLDIAARPITIYDPLTYDPATNQRSAFPANKIPTNRFDPVAAYMLRLFPESNRAGDPNGQNNFAGFNSDDTRRNNFTFRADQNFGTNHRLYLRITRNAFHDDPNYWAGPATAGVRNTYVLEPSSSVNYSWTARPTLIITSQFGVTPRVSEFAPKFDGFDPTQIPFAANARASLDPRYIPNLSFEKLSGLSGTFITTNLRERYFVGNVSATKIWARHTLKVGYEIRKPYLNDSEPGAPSGSGNFDGAWTGLNQQATQAQQGSGFASYLLGIPNNFSFDSGKEAYALGFGNHGAYVQDDFRVTSKLTLNLGLRWEYETPITERYNRLVTVDYQADNGYKIRPGYDFNRDVIGAGLLPAGSPIPKLQGPFLGGVVPVASSRFPERGNTQSNPYNFGPRFGLAYRITPTTVFRGGFGILYASYTGNASGSDSYGASAFFKTRGTANITTDSGRTYMATLSNPFPNDAGLLVGTNDQTVTQNRYFGNINRSFEWNHKPAYEIQYNGGLQQQLGQWVFEGTFVANKGVHLYVGGNPSYNTLDPAYLSLGAQLEKAVPNPFFGAGLPDNATQLSAPTIPYKFLLLPHPNLTGGAVILQRPSGNSQYFAGYFKAERRYTNSLSLLVSYSVTKLIDDTDGKASNPYSLPQDGANFRDIRGLSAQDIPQKLVVTYLYDLPIGRGKRFLSHANGIGGKALDAIAGGWKIAGFSLIQSGYPLQIQQTDNFTAGIGYGKLRPSLTGQSYFGSDISSSVGLPGQGQTGRYVNPAAFSVTPRYSFGNSPAVLPNMRQPRYNQTDLALLKQFRFTESRFVELRVEAQNAFNHPIFQLDNNTMNIQNANFGLFNSTANSPRNLQFGVRFVF